MFLNHQFWQQPNTSGSLILLAAVVVKASFKKLYLISKCALIVECVSSEGHYANSFPLESKCHRQPELRQHPTGKTSSSDSFTNLCTGVEWRETGAMGEKG